MEGKRWMERGFRERWRGEGEMKCGGRGRTNTLQNKKEKAVKKNTGSNFKVPFYFGKSAAH